MKIKVDKSVYVKNDEPQVGDLFIAVQESGNQVSYLISSDQSELAFINLQSGYKSYTGISVEQLVKNYLDKNRTTGINPVKEYFFVKGFKVSLNVHDTFGYKSREN